MLMSRPSVRPSLMSTPLRGFQKFIRSLKKLRINFLNFFVSKKCAQRTSIFFFGPPNLPYYSRKKNIKNFEGLGVLGAGGMLMSLTSLTHSLMSTPLRGFQKFIRSFEETSNKFLKFFCFEEVRAAHFDFFFRAPKSSVF